jgi:hypothetical protein
MTNSKTNEMKTGYIFACCLILFFSCSINEDDHFTEKTFSNSNGTTLMISEVDWWTIKQSITSGYMGGYSFLTVKMKITGKTNGDSINVKSTLGNKIDYVGVDIKEDSTFSDEVTISYQTILTTKIPNDKFTSNAEIYVYKGLDTLKVSFDSKFLKY